ncbi:MAG: S-methyl-5'-thioadenosine phosphorylase [Deltaproteobacteria bacterium]|nr:S-methyl-5'-thioadenosine phosphorylase [Deltaproteobacteria bacterium]MBN2674624.1 S-methyl-5'-thioadenosine phosphorylase [Deltaproteobacteria bacterium]
MNNVLAIIGGSGLYSLPELTDVKKIEVDTPFGAPSSPVVEGKIGDTRVLFLARHGEGHVFLPTEVNYRANVFALKQQGATHLLSISAVGSLKEEIVPGDLVVTRQYIDRTKGRPSTFFGDGVVGHVMFADPVCPELSDLVFATATDLQFTVHDNATLVVMEGPAFSTRAESHLHRSFGAELIGMTAMPEAKLAREAELCYGTLALATDYDCWREGEEDVSVDAVVATIRSNVEKSRKMVVALAARVAALSRGCACPVALDTAIITDRDKIPESTRVKLAPIMGRVL